MRKPLYLLSLLFVTLTSCSRYNPELPPTIIPSAWKGNFKNEECCFNKDRFWVLFEDLYLNELIEEAIKANFDLQIAKERIEQARAHVLRQHGARVPEANVQLSFSQDETLIDPRDYGAGRKHLDRVKQQQYSLLGGLSYEIDLWGKLKDKEKGAYHRLQASQWEHEFVYQTLVIDVALHYFSLRTYEEELEYLERVKNLWQDAASLNEERVKAGLDSEIDLSRANLEFALASVLYEEVKKDYNIEENALATLLGKPASDWSIIPGKLPDSIPKVPHILPSNLLMRRADIQAAQALVSAGKSDVDVAIKSYFPSFPLTASLGILSPLFSDFFTWQARYWNYVLTSVQSVFDGGRKKSDVEEAKAIFRENFVRYQKTVNRAFQDVEDALTNAEATRLQLEAQSQAFDAAQDTFHLAKEQFESGLISYLLIADAENTQINVGRKLIALKGEQIANWLRIMKAIGVQYNPTLTSEKHF